MSKYCSRLFHDVPHWIDTDEAVFFITISCSERRKNSLCVPETAEVIFNATRHYVDKHQWYPHVLLLMPDHLHMLVSFNLRNEPMTKIVKSWKRWCARNTNIKWQRGFFEHRLRNSENLKEKADYILQNPFRQDLIESGQEWKYVWFPDSAPLRTTDPTSVGSGDCPQSPEV